MAPDTFHLAPCTPSDIPSMISIYESAFANDYFSSFTFPSTIPLSEKHRWLRDRFLGTFQKTRAPQFQNRGNEYRAHGSLGSMGIPHTFTEEELKKQELEKDEWPQGSNLEVCDVKFGALHEKRERYADKGRLIIVVVYLLCTDPRFQRKGLARRLLQYGLDLADQEGGKTYIEATKDGHPVYLKLGFKDIDIVTMDLSKWGGKELGVNRIMMRDPKPLE